MPLPWKRTKPSTPNPPSLMSLMAETARLQREIPRTRHENTLPPNPPEHEQAPEIHQRQKAPNIESILASVQKSLSRLGSNCDEDYLISSNDAQVSLKSHLHVMRTLLAFSKDPTELCGKNFFQSYMYLHEELGMYQEVEDWLSDFFPALGFENGIVTGIRESLRYKQANGEETQKLIPDDGCVRLLIYYIRFLAKTGKRLDFADAITRMLPWLMKPHPRDYFSLQLSIVQILNQRSKYSEAANQITIWENSDHVATTPKYSAMRLQVALNKAGLKPVTNKTEQERIESAQRAFIHAFVSSSIEFGLWHSSTLEILYHFAKALREWNFLEAAATLQEECYIGSIYRFGIAHPRSKKSLVELQKGRLPQSRLYDLQLFGQANYDREKRLSIAYEHIHLNTAVDLLQHIAKTVKINYTNIKYIASWYVSSGDIDITCRCRAERLALQCIYRPGHDNTAEKILDNKTWNVFGWDGPAPSVELLKHSSDPQKFSKAILQSCLRQGSYDVHQREAIYRRLTADGHMHFTREMIAEEPPLILEKDSKPIGAGAFAVVDSIKIEQRLYARKALSLPRYRQKAILKIIQNEISIVRALEHPHIVQIFLTYEEKLSFYIVMQPLADCDLEAYLHEHAQGPPTQDQRDMVWKWMHCLSNTLAYIHFKGIRHKDIKPRNILIKGTDVVFADFGSSHTFVDDGHSTTEGPSFGHTKIYCAPEVLASGKRGRMSDIFSLGCVFIELAVWLSGSTLEKWNKQREIDLDGVSDNTYSATLMQITRMMGLTQIDREMCGLYESVIKLMLREEPKQRPLAVEIGERVVRSYQHIYGKPEGFQQCSACQLERYVDVANAGTAYAMSLDTSTSLLEGEVQEN